jgi:hypothetical protein
MLKPLLAMGLVCCAGVLPAAAQDADLTVRHIAVVAGADGVKRTSEFAERMVRRKDAIWIERIVPAGWHTAQSHAKAGAGHRHLDVALAARWIDRLPDGKTRVRLASSEEKVLVDVAPTEFANIGFDGSWTGAYHLIDPAALKRMRVVKTEGERVTYASTTAGNALTIVWNERLQLPVQVDSVSGASSRRTLVEVAPTPAATPFATAAGYARKDYSDYLD